MKCRHTVFLLGITLPICVILRIIQMVFTIEETTGFIKQQYSAIGTLITVIIFAAILSVSLIAGTNDVIKSQQKTVKPGVAATAILAGGMFIYRTVSEISLLGAGSWYDIFVVIFCLLSAFSFMAYGLKNIYEYNMPSIIMAIPVLYYVVKLISIFMNTSKLARVTENIFMIFVNAALLLFMFEFASAENGIGDIEKKKKKIFAYGISVVMLCVTTALPKMLLIIFSESKKQHGDISNPLLDLAVAAFVLTYMLYDFVESGKTNTKSAPKHLA